MTAPSAPALTASSKNISHIRKNSTHWSAAANRNHEDYAFMTDTGLHFEQYAGFFVFMPKKSNKNTELYI